MATITYNATVYVWEQCGSCGIWYTVPQVVYEAHRKEGGFHYCPSGHGWGWKQGQGSDAFDALTRERDRLKQQQAQLEDEVAEQRRLTAAAEKKYLQARRRAAAGVCPCCNRTFQNVQRHMLTKHANVVPLAQKTAS